MAALHILRPGLFTTLQDLGRVGFRDLGVPPAGALDPVGLRLANALVGNAPGEGALELSYVGPTLRVEGGNIRIALTGPVAARRLRDGEVAVLDSNRSHLLLPGDVLELGAASGATLAVEGGFGLSPVLGSLATYTRAGLGPLGGRALAAGDVLPLNRPAVERGEKALAAPFDYGSGPLRVIAGPQDDHFTPEALQTLVSAEYRVGKDADRMGLRLEGPVLGHAKPPGIASDGLVAGCIQVPGNGAPILLLADHQTVGGYAKIATVISADLPRAGRSLPGDVLCFRRVGMEEAEAARADLERRVAAAIAAMAETRDGLDLAALYNANLVSGMVAGGEDEG